MKYDVNNSRLEDTVFYTIEKAIKSYRKFAQKNISAHKLDITIDQWLVLKTLVDDPEISQKEIAKKVFKDYASITRIIEILVRKKFLNRTFHSADRRRFQLKLTAAGNRIYKKLTPIIESNRKSALKGISKKNISVLSELLSQVTENCNPIDITYSRTKKPQKL